MKFVDGFYSFGPFVQFVGSICFLRLLFVNHLKDQTYNLQMGTVLQKVIYFKSTYLSSGIQKQFLNEEQRVYRRDQIVKAVKFIANANSTDYRSLKQIYKHLHCLLHYLTNAHQRDPFIDEMLKNEDQSFKYSSKLVLYTYRKYLQSVVPTNITFFHFMRQKDIYIHYTVLRYSLVAEMMTGLKSNDKFDLFGRIKHDERVETLKLLLPWLSNLISYRCSAIYLKSPSIDYLIEVCYYMLCALISRSQQHPLSCFKEEQVKQSFKNLMRINCYMLSTSVTNNSSNMKLVLSIIMQLFMHNEHHELNIFIPTYLYVDLIGFLQNPVANETILKLVIYIIRSQMALHKKEHLTQQMIEDTEAQLLRLDQISIANCWAILILITQEYSSSHQEDVVQLIYESINHFAKHSLVRGFIIKLIKILHVENDEELQKWIHQHKKDYLFEGNILKIQSIYKNYAKAIENYRQFYLKQQIRKTDSSINQKDVWLLMVKMNDTTVIKDEDEGQNEFS